jgi:hypothetical protein
VSKTQGTAYTYSGALTVHGAGLTAKSGWSTAEKISFTFNARGNVCGNTAGKSISETGGNRPTAGVASSPAD